jgi:hypothetical protein
MSQPTGAIRESEEDIAGGGGLTIAVRASRGWSQARMRGHSPKVGGAFCI